jgi:hypothetical protein
MRKVAAVKVKPLTTDSPFSLPAQEPRKILDFREHTLQIFGAPTPVEVWVARSLFHVDEEQIWRRHMA